MNRDALVVGINSYQGGGLRRLKSPAKDAEEIAQLLERYGNFRVRRLPEFLNRFKNKREVAWHQEVTINQLKKAIKQLFYPESKQKPELALLYFSGHGLREIWAGQSKGYLATSDANPDKEIWGFSLEDLQKLLQRSKIHEQIVWLDCCHSGELLSGEFFSSQADLSRTEADKFLIADENLQEFVPGSQEDYARCLITASRGFESAFGQTDSKHGVLTSALLKGLDPTRRSDGLVTSKMLAEFLKQALTRENQCPVFYISGKPIVLTTKYVPPIPGDEAKVEICPYKGLKYFDLGDAEIFYGRAALTDQLLYKVRQQNFLAVIGPSGSGKSSVVRAGLLSELKLGRKLSRSDLWQYDYKPFTPGEYPLQKLEQVIGAKANELAQVILADEHERVVLFIDQFEECFTLCKGSEEKERERQKFFECLLNTLEQTAGKLCLIIAIRADFLGKCAEYPRLASKLTRESWELVQPMSRKELELAIKEPAQKVGLEVQSLLVSRMIEDVEGSPGSLPLLEFTLTKLYEAQRKSYLGKLTLFSYNELGGVKGTLEKFANDEYENLLPEEQIVAKRIFLELTQLGEGTEDTRRRIMKQDLLNKQQPKDKDLLNEVINKLATARLITTDAKEKGEKEEVIDIAHEALIRNWKLLQGWLNENRDLLRQKRKLEDDAKEWIQSGKQEDYLLPGAKLAEAERYFQNPDQLEMLDEVTKEFLRESQKKEEEKQQRAQQELDKLNNIISLGQALEQFRFDQINALLTAMEAGQKLNDLDRSGSSSKDLPLNALGQILDSIQEQNRFSGHTDTVWSVSFDPNGKYLATGDEGGTARLWHRDGKEVKKFTRHAGRVYSVTFSPDENGKYLATASADSTARLWHRDGTFIQEFTGHTNQVRCVAFSPDEDGKYLATASFDGTVRLWSRDGKVVKEFTAHGGAAVYSVAFSPDGKYLATASANGTARLWRRDGTLVHEFTGHKGPVWSITFSPNGKTLATASDDKTARLWHLDGSLVQDFMHLGALLSVAFSPDEDGKYLATASENGTARLWHRDGTLVHEFTGHPGRVASVTFSSDGKYLVTGDEGGTARQWFIEPQAFTEDNNGVLSVTFSPDGEYLATASADKTARLLRRDGTLVHKFTGHRKWVRSVAFSPDGKYLATASDDKTARLWHRDGTLKQEFTGHRGVVYSVAFSPGEDGEYLVATASADGTARLWHLDGTLVREFIGHKGGVRNVAFSPDGKYLATASWDHTVRLWLIETLDELLERGCKWLKNYLNHHPSDWERLKKTCAKNKSLTK